MLMLGCSINAFTLYAAAEAGASSIDAPDAATISRNVNGYQVDLSLSSEVEEATSYIIETQVYDSNTSSWVNHYKALVTTLSGDGPYTSTIDMPPCEVRIRLRATDGSNTSTPSPWSNTLIHADYIVDGSSGNDLDSGVDDANAWVSFDPIRDLADSQSSSDVSLILVRQGTYTDSLDLSSGHLPEGRIDIGLEPLTQVVNPEPENNFGNGVDASNGLRLEITGLGPLSSKSIIRGFNRNDGSLSDNGVSVRAGSETYVHNLHIYGCADGASSHGSGSTIGLYDCQVDQCSRAVIQPDGNTNTIIAQRCRMEAGESGTVYYALGIINNTLIQFEDVIMLARQAASVGSDHDMAITSLQNGSHFKRCQLGDPTRNIRIQFNGATASDDVLIEDSYLNVDLYNNGWRSALTLRRCYGYIYGRLRGLSTDPNTIIENCVFIGGTQMIYGNYYAAGFEGVGYTISNSVFIGFSSTALGGGFTSEQITSWLANSSVANCCDYNNGTFINASLSASVTGTLTSDPELAGGDEETVKASVDQLDWCVTAAALIGAGTSGANVGFTASDIST